MTLRCNLEDLPMHLRSQAQEQLLGTPQPKPKAGPNRQPSDPTAPDMDECPTCGHKRKRRKKYRAQRTKIDNIWFDSKKEALRYLALCTEVITGKITRFHRQVPFDLPGGVVYVIDFMIVELDGSLTYEDTKGIETPVFKLKLKQVEDTYKIEVRIT